jgi:hypothetical protein
MLSASALSLSFFFLDLNKDDMLLVNDLRGVESPDELRGVAPPAMAIIAVRRVRQRSTARQGAIQRTCARG